MVRMVENERSWAIDLIGLNPSLLSEADKIEIINAFNKAKNRNVLPF